MGWNCGGMIVTSYAIIFELHYRYRHVRKMNRFQGGAEIWIHGKDPRYQVYSNRARGKSHRSHSLKISKLEQAYSLNGASSFWFLDRGKIDPQPLRQEITSVCKAVMAVIFVPENGSGGIDKLLSIDCRVSLCSVLSPAALYYIISPAAS